MEKSKELESVYIAARGKASTAKPEGGEQAAGEGGEAGSAEDGPAVEEVE